LIITQIINAGGGFAAGGSSGGGGGGSKETIYNKIIDPDFSYAEHLFPPIVEPASTYFSLTQIWDAVPAFQTLIEGGLDSGVLLGGHYATSTDLVTIEPDLIAANIATGTDIFGVIGTCEVAPVDTCTNEATNSACWSTIATDKTWGPSPSISGVSSDLSELNGKNNTRTLYNLSSTLYPAADYCYTLTEGGFSVGTWYLPSYAELSAGWGALGLTGFPSGRYWSSTEMWGNREIAVYYLNTFGFFIDNDLKRNSNSVRCLR
jgi:hypothetical protein